MHTFFNYCLLRDTERNKEKAKGISFSQEASGSHNLRGYKPLTSDSQGVTTWAVPLAPLLEICPMNSSQQWQIKVSENLVLLGCPMVNLWGVSGVEVNRKLWSLKRFSVLGRQQHEDGEVVHGTVTHLTSIHRATHMLAGAAATPSPSQAGRCLCRGGSIATYSFLRPTVRVPRVTDSLRVHRALWHRFFWGIPRTMWERE